MLSDLSFTVKAGRAGRRSIGRTGAGKSTVFKLLLGLYLGRKSGTVTIGGVDVSQITDRQRRTVHRLRGAAFCPRAGHGARPDHAGRPAALRGTWRRQAARLAGHGCGPSAAFPDGYDTPLHVTACFRRANGSSLSIARAAAADPAVLLLDEITANLDAQTEARVLEALRRASAGQTSNFHLPPHL